jgi:hypothetical protein
VRARPRTWRTISASSKAPRPYRTIPAGPRCRGVERLGSGRPAGRAGASMCGGLHSTASRPKALCQAASIGSAASVTVPPAAASSTGGCRRTAARERRRPPPPAGRPAGRRRLRPGPSGGWRVAYWSFRVGASRGRCSPPPTAPDPGREPCQQAVQAAWSTTEPAMVVWPRSSLLTSRPSNQADQWRSRTALTRISSCIGSSTATGRSGDQRVSRAMTASRMLLLESHSAHLANR